MKVVQRIWTDTIEGIIDDTPDKIRESESRKRLDELGEAEISEEELEIRKKRQKRKKKIKIEDENENDDEVPVNEDDDEDWDPHGLYRDENEYWNDDFGKYEGVRKKLDGNEGVKKEKEEKKDVDVIQSKIYLFNYF